MSESLIFLIHLEARRSPADTISTSRPPRCSHSCKETILPTEQAFSSRSVRKMLGQRRFRGGKRSLGSDGTLGSELQKHCRI